MGCGGVGDWRKSLVELKIFLSSSQILAWRCFLVIKGSLPFFAL